MKKEKIGYGIQAMFPINVPDVPPSVVRSTVTPFPQVPLRVKTPGRSREPRAHPKFTSW